MLEKQVPDPFLKNKIEHSLKFYRALFYALF